MKVNSSSHRFIELASKDANLFLHHLSAALGHCPCHHCREQGAELVRVAQSRVLHAMDWAQASLRLHEANPSSSSLAVALGGCLELYRDAEPRLARLVSGESYSGDDAVTWLSGVVASHRSCLDGLEEKGWLFETMEAQNLTFWLSEALAFYGARSNRRDRNKGKLLISVFA
ncbi:hypothetical protein RJ640_006767 [Escallonia rubra]|uniref:Pectinesterase inhibitor domain-containing protein n=1 Tax=Escallonia rubra TaxID=112253 RepID=A0AA88RRJ1_9ASTE|nr:hypothetical protein RJ640_006767 [Escallonia rubra]